MKYQRLEIEKVEFGGMNFMCWSGTYSGSEWNCFAHQITYGRKTYSNTTCQSITKSGGLSQCDIFFMRNDEEAIECNGYSFSCPAY